ncbi:MAG: peptidase M23 [Helicobacteraceae bacterium CG2_30_36_10]|nr:MAG: peptidase M23 [Helicobacteraceae bacterium CG2_30_36_10]
MRFFLVSIFFISTLAALNVNISDSTILNGKTALIELEKDENIQYNEISIGKKKYKIFNNPVNDKKMYVLIPIGYYEKPRNVQAKLTYKEKNSDVSKTLFFHIKDAKYQKETIKVSNSKVNLNKKDLKRSAKENKEATDIYNSVTDKSYISSSFILPMESEITSSFGKARVYNETLKGYHSGTDFRADVGTPIKSCNDGVVVLAKDRFYSGGSVIIDHGQGIYTCYFHMSEFSVKKNQKIKKAQIIGLSGKSGRVTGPHLHFSAKVSGVQVDPMQLILLMNEKLLIKQNYKE